MAPDAAAKVEVPEWLRRHYELVDAAALDEYIEDFSDDARLRFGADPVVTGKEAIRARFAGGHAARRTHHEYRNVWEAGSTTIVEFDARYTFPDGETVSANALVIIEREGGLIEELRVSMDQTPLRR
jgi:ketosteroid isomerase-like protein